MRKPALLLFLRVAVMCPAALVGSELQLTDGRKITGELITPVLVFKTPAEDGSIGLWAIPSKAVVSITASKGKPGELLVAFDAVDLVFGSVSKDNLLGVGVEEAFAKSIADRALSPPANNGMTVLTVGGRDRAYSWVVKNGSAKEAVFQWASLSLSVKTSDDRTETVETVKIAVLRK